MVGCEGDQIIKALRYMTDEESLDIIPFNPGSNPRWQKFCPHCADGKTEAHRM